MDASDSQSNAQPRGLWGAGSAPPSSPSTYIVDRVQRLRRPRGQPNTPQQQTIPRGAAARDQTQEDGGVQRPSVTVASRLSFAHSSRRLVAADSAVHDHFLPLLPPYHSHPRRWRLDPHDPGCARTENNPPPHPPTRRATSNKYHQARAGAGARQRTYSGTGRRATMWLSYFFSSSFWCSVSPGIFWRSPTDA